MNSLKNFAAVTGVVYVLLIMTLARLRSVLVEFGRGRRPVWVPKPRHLGLEAEWVPVTEAFKRQPEVGVTRETAQPLQGAAGHGM